MKRTIKAIIIALVVSAPFVLSAQEPPHPNNNGGAPTPGGNTPVGGGAPIGSGMTILVALGAMYAGKKVFHLNKD